MQPTNKAVLEEANAAILLGDYEGFLAHCTEDTSWNFIGDQTLEGKEAVRVYMAKTYREPPRFTVENLVGEGDLVVAQGRITLKEEGKETDYAYCDVWTFRDGKMAGLKAFVVKP